MLIFISICLPLSAEMPDYNLDSGTVLDVETDLGIIAIKNTHFLDNGKLYNGIVYHDVKLETPWGSLVLPRGVSISFYENNNPRILHIKERIYVLTPFGRYFSDVILLNPDTTVRGLGFYGNDEFVNVMTPIGELKVKSFEFDKNSNITQVVLTENVATKNKWGNILISKGYNLSFYPNGQVSQAFLAEKTALDTVLGTISNINHISFYPDGSVKQINSEPGVFCTSDKGKLKGKGLYFHPSGRLQKYEFAEPVSYHTICGDFKLSSLTTYEDNSDKILILSSPAPVMTPSGVFIVNGLQFYSDGTLEVVRLAEAVIIDGLVYPANSFLGWKGIRFLGRMKFDPETSVFERMEE